MPLARAAIFEGRFRPLSHDATPSNEARDGTLDGQSRLGQEQVQDTLGRRDAKRDVFRMARPPLLEYTGVRESYCPGG